MHHPLLQLPWAYYSNRDESSGYLLTLSQLFVYLYSTYSFSAICLLILCSLFTFAGFVGDPEMFCMPPIGPPLCSPGCGVHSHCEYGAPNKCVCDSGFGGNPYIGCKTAQQQGGSCATLKCGNNAICSMTSGTPQCICTKGYTGNPYSNCLDIDECSVPVCGENAVCINIPGSYDCRCKNGFIGNPYQICTVENDEERDDLCKNQRCGPNAVCNLGQCLCAPGFKGDDPYDASKGCSAVSQCSYTTDCGYNEICTVLPNTVHRQCVDACARYDFT